MRAQHPVDCKSSGLGVDEGLLLLPLTEADVRRRGAPPTTRMRLMGSYMRGAVVQSRAGMELVSAVVPLQLLRLGARGPRGSRFCRRRCRSRRRSCRVRQRGHPLGGMAQHVAPVARNHGSMHEVTLHHLNRGLPSVSSRHGGDGGAARLHAPTSALRVDHRAG